MKLNISLSARNTLKGKVIDLKKGQTTIHIKIDIGCGNVLTASITNEAVDELNLNVGDDAWGIIKASDVMVGK